MLNPTAMTKQQITTEIEKLQRPCHEVFRARREARIAELQAALVTAPQSREAATDDEALAKWNEIQKRETRLERQIERRGYSD